MTRIHSAILFCLVLFNLGVRAQVALPTTTRTQSSGIVSPQPVNPAIADVGPLVARLAGTAQAMNLDISQLRIEKWKADGSTKRQSQENADSIERNLTAALPAIMDQVRSNPQSLEATFKLYRNVNALYDVFAALTESAGAFGPKGEYTLLAGDADTLDGLRRALGDRVEKLASMADNELARLRTEVAAKSSPPPAPKKIVVDDEEPAKKPVRKKKTVKKPAESNPANNASNSSSSGKQQ